MFLRLLFILTFIPFLEIYFLLRLGDAIGWTQTFFIIFFTGFLGAWLLKKQGRSILTQVQQSTMQNQMPTEAMAKGFLTFVGGLLLLTPGIVTDVLGLSLIFPLTQILWKKYFVGQMKKGVASGQVHFYSNIGNQRNPFDSSAQKPQNGQIQNDIIDVQASRSQTVDKKTED